MVPRDTSQRLLYPRGHEIRGLVGRLRDFDSIVAYLSDREIDELQAAIDARREARSPRAGLGEAKGRPAALPPVDPPRPAPAR